MCANTNANNNHVCTCNARRVVAHKCAPMFAYPGVCTRVLRVKKGRIYFMHTRRVQSQFIVHQGHVHFMIDGFIA